MAYASPMKIANGLVLDFTVDNADTAADTFLGLNASGEVTKFASVPRSRVSGGGNITEATSSVLSITGGTAAVLTSGLTIQVLQAGAAQSGYLSTTDWNTFNNKLGPSLTSAYIYVGNGSNVATGVAMSGDISITNAGNAQIVAGAIIDADVNASAAIAFSKMASLTASRVLGSDGSGFIQALDTATYPSLTELAYVKGVTSAIQTQLNNRLSVTLTSPTNGDVITYNGAAWVNSPSSTGVPTAGTTAQILRKIDNTNYNTEWHTLVAADITDVSSTAAELNKLSGVTTTATQFNFLNTLSGDVQAQLAAKVGTSLTQNYMFVGDASNVVSTLAPGTNGYVLTSVSGVPTWVSPGVGGTVTSVAASGGTTGMSFTGSPITTSGTLTLTGTLAIANGGTGLTALGTAGQLIKVNAGATALEYFTPSYMTLTGTQTNSATNVWSGSNRFISNSLQIRNSANTFSYYFEGGTIASDSFITLPNLSSSDFLAVLNSAQTFTNKTISGLSNTLSNITSASIATTLSGKILTSPRFETLSTIGHVWTASGTDGSGGWAASSGGGITNGAAANELMISDGTNAVGRKIYSSSDGNLILGNSSLAGANRLITIDSSVGTADLMLEGLSTGYVYVTGGRFAVNNSRVSLYTNISINSTTSLMRIFGTYWNSSATAQYFEILGADGIAGLTGGQHMYIKAGNGYSSGNTNGGHLYLDSGVKNASGLTGNIGLFESNLANWQNMEGGIYVKNRVTSPTSGLLNGVAFYAKDSNSSSELYTFTESGAEVNISGLLEPVTESGTSFSLGESHRNKIVLCTNSGAITVTVGSGKAAGWNCMLVATHATGTITLSASGTTLNGTTSTTTQFETLSIVHYGSEAYLSKLG